MRLAGAATALAGVPIVAFDNVLSATAKQAAVVIAEARAYASTGTYTQGDFRAQRLAAAVKAEGSSVILFAALSALAQALGVDAPVSADAALGELAAANPAYQAAHDLLIGDGVRLSVPATPRAQQAPVEPLAANDGIRVITGRDLYTAEDAAALRHPEAEKLHRYDRIQVSEQDARRLGISDNDVIEVTDGSTTISAMATVTERVPDGAVYISSLLQGGAVTAFFTSDAIPSVKLGAPVPA
jgi:NADH-quinone oxidoreductase subunit G